MTDFILVPGPDALRVRREGRQLSQKIFYSDSPGEKENMAEFQNILTMNLRYRRERRPGLSFEPQ
jgi:hypothetical protein